MTKETTTDESRNELGGQNERLVMLDKLKAMTEVQCSDGNWNYDPYMHGMANGMIFAVSCMEDKEPVYLEAPEIWVKDLPPLNSPIAVGDEA